MNESADESDIAQFAIFVREIDNDCNITADVAGLMSMKRTANEDFHNEIRNVL
jgi:hypothetical protein